ncbi:uncharacterized protein LOC131252682 isoform X2 [Magnolia sinica]|uniref:uncharacterized protein LOC131252682 isoform X2 n=1 Tax=Magnolia sinica TaxID=86752 RepID=UPI002657DF07|nr:uncharacterized protein LOC131252682 isoform X2 [Magnolia sinica]
MHMALSKCWQCLGETFFNTGSFTRMSYSCIHTFGQFVHSRPASKRRDLILVRQRIQCSSWHHPVCMWPGHLPLSIAVPHHVMSHLHSWSQLQVKSGESEGALSGEGVILDEQTLEQDLQRAIEEENYARAAKIRDSLRILHEDSKASILAANARFYNAFKNGDLAAMHAIWAKGDSVFCVHPGAGGISGYDLVMGSWELVLGADYEFPIHIDLKNVEVHVKGDIGYVTCMEVVKTKGSSWGKQVATNVFERADGQWFMCVHHASHIDL